MKFLRPVPGKFPISNPYGHWEPYSNYYMNPTTKRWTHGQVDGKGQHKGTDFAVPVGIPITAACDGLVVACGFENPNDAKQGFGLRIRQQITTDDEIPMTVVYAHMSSLGVQPGHQIVKGDRLGYSGNTGHTTGPHLHVELVDGKGQYHEMEFYEANPSTPPAPVEPDPEAPTPPLSEAPPESA